MSNITLAQGSIMLEQFGDIRVNENGDLSVYDLVRVIGGQKDPYNAWKRLSKEFSAELTNCQDWKFPGERQRKTPVCNKETALKIIGLLPSAAGKAYRDAAAKLVLSYLEDPDQLAEAAIARTEKVAPEKLERLQSIIIEANNRVKGVDHRSQFTKMMEKQGVPRDKMGAATDRVYIASLGMRAREIKEQATGGKKSSASARSYLKDTAIKLVSWLEESAALIADRDGDDVVALAEEFAEQATRNLNPRLKEEMVSFRDKPLTPDKARKIVKGL